MPKLYSHNFIADAELAPHGSSFIEEQEEERQAEEEVEGITLEENFNFEVDLSEEVIRKKGLETQNFAISHKKNNAHLTGSPESYNRGTNGFCIKARGIFHQGHRRILD